MNESMISEQPHRPSAISAFFSGGMSGLISGVVMSLVIASVAPLLPLIPFISVGVAGASFMGTLTASGPLMILASTLFGGIMSAKRAMFDAPHNAYHSNANTLVPIPVQGMSGPAMAPVMTYADAPEQAPTKSWVAETGRNEGSQSRIQQILADGSLNDKDRASAILASREATDQHASRA